MTLSKLIARMGFKLFVLGEGIAETGLFYIFNDGKCYWYEVKLLNNNNMEEQVNAQKLKKELEFHFGSDNVSYGETPHEFLLKVKELGVDAIQTISNLLTISYVIMKVSDMEILAVFKAKEESKVFNPTHAEQKVA